MLMLSSNCRDVNVAEDLMLVGVVDCSHGSHLSRSQMLALLAKACVHGL
jgi:hypothetical protein